MSHEALQHLRIRLPKWLTSWSIFLLDVIPSFIAFKFFLIPEISLSIYNTISYFVLIQAFWSTLFLSLNLYNPSATSSRFIEIQRVVLTTFTIVVLMIFFDAINYLNWPINPQTTMRYWFIFTFGLITSRIVFRTFQKYLLRKGFGRSNTVIVGFNSRGMETAKQILDHNNLGYDIIGFVQAVDDQNINKFETNIPILGEENELKEIILNNQVSEVVLALEKLQHNRMMEVITHANGSPVSIKIVPDMYEVISGLARTEQIYGVPLIQVNPNLNTFYNKYLKRLLDLIIAIPCLLIFFPFWGIISLLIKFDSTGPVLYKQNRIGENNTTFTIRKFRSMYYDAEKDSGPVWASDEDPRITRVGAWLRRFRLDEIPQLINVVKGEMSIIGPRPERPFFIDKLMQEFPFYYRRHKVRPGITGWSQIKQPYDKDIDDVRKKLKFDFYYIENLSFSLDVKILASTFWVMLSGKGR